MVSDEEQYELCLVVLTVSCCADMMFCVQNMFTSVLLIMTKNDVYWFLFCCCILVGPALIQM